MKKVDPEDFIQCHRMYVVNKKHIVSIDVVNRMIELEDKNMVEVGVTYKDKIKDIVGKK